MSRSLKLLLALLSCILIVIGASMARGDSEQVLLNMPLNMPLVNADV